MSWILPPSASEFAGRIDFIYYLILVITGIAFVVVEAGLIWFIIKYRARPGQKAHYTHGNVKAEVIWTAIPAVTVVLIGVLSGAVWSDVKGRNSVPPNAITYGVTAQQFEWHFAYAGQDAQLGTADDFSVRNQLHIPVNRPVELRMSSEDVIHSFFVRAFRVKQDIVPGMETVVWFEATETGDFDVACAELCGLGHYRMGATVTVHSQEDYDRWLAEQMTTTALR
jgi:cytochrome c oxidase subunit 2